METTPLTEITRTTASQSAGLVRLGEDLGGWICDRIWLEDDDTVSVKLRLPAVNDWIVIVVTKKDDGTVFRKLEHCSVRYRARVTDRTQMIRAAIGDLIHSIANGVDRALAANPSATVAQALGRSTEPRALVFGRDAMLEILSGHIPLGATLCGGWQFVDVMPSSQVRGLKEDQPFVVLDFRHGASSRRVMFQVKKRVEGELAFVNTANFAVHLVTGMGDVSGSEALQAFVSFVIALHDHASLTWIYPENLDVNVASAPLLPPSAAEVTALLDLNAGQTPTLEPADANQVLNLSIISECFQQCAFCSVKETTAPKDGGEATFASLCRDLYDSRKSGVRRVRINGYDPLTFSRIVETIGFATKLGFDFMEIFSPFTRFADAAFCDAVLAVVPAHTDFMVPLYGLDADVHDRVVKRPGAFALVMKALDNLSERGRSGSVHLIAVATRVNQGELAKIWTFARGRGYEAHGHLPYPSFESRGDRYYGSAPRQADVVAGAASAIAETPPTVDTPFFVYQMLAGVAPCVSFRGMRKARIPLKRWLSARAATTLPGTEYRHERYSHRSGEETFEVTTLPCPHAERCVLATACSREILRGYAELFGVDEFQPVSLGDLIAAT